MNKIFLLGNLEKDPEIVSSKKSCWKISLKMDDPIICRDKTKITYKSWKSAIVFGHHRSSFIGLQKGGLVLVEGQISTKMSLKNEIEKMSKTIILESNHIVRIS